MSSIVVSDLDYAPPGAVPLFFDVGFGVSPGEHAALVGPNGVAKSTISTSPTTTSTLSARSGWPGW